MSLDDLEAVSRRERARVIAIVAALVVVALSLSAWWLEPPPPRRIVLASGPEGGLYSAHAQRYVEQLAHAGVTVVERKTQGSGENLQLLLDPGSGVDVAFLQGGLEQPPKTDGLVMLASLHYEPLWVLYRDSAVLTQLNHLRGKRIAVGDPRSGTHVFAAPLLAANGVTVADGVGFGNTEIVSIGGADALDALKSGTVDVVMMVSGAQSPVVQKALRDPEIRLMSVRRAEAYARRLPFIVRLTLPPGAVDFATNNPERDVTLIGTKAMLVARETFHPALTSLLIDAAREIHSEQGLFEAAGEFPSTSPVDLRVSPAADQHRRFGSRVLYHYLPFWVANFVERALLFVVPLLVVVVPLANFLPQFLRHRVRARIFRWYGELALLERDVRTRSGAAPIEQWLRDLDRIERAAEAVRAPASYAAEAYTLREHIGLVRNAVLAKVGGAPPRAAPKPADG